jgi:hypothetical protein
MAQAKGTNGKRALAGCVLGVGGVALAALVLAWQSYVWLETGHWPHITLGTVAVPIISGSDFSAWLADPRSWYGLHNVVRFLFDLPLWAWLCGCSGVAIPLLKNRPDSN